MPVDRPDAPAIMTDRDLDALTAAPAGERIAYGGSPMQFGELSLPIGAGPYPVIVNIHGGIWLAQYDIAHSRAQAHALAREGFAVWNVEYRRVGDDGGGWPGTFLDVATAADHLRIIARSKALDLNRAIAMGHSAGGQLALWLASRSQLPIDSALFSADPLRVRGVVALAPATELATLQERGSYGGVVDQLLGGTPSEVGERYEWTMPSRRVPLGVPQRIIVGQARRDMGVAFAGIRACGASSKGLIRQGHRRRTGGALRVDCAIVIELAAGRACGTGVDCRAMIVS